MHLAPGTRVGPYEIVAPLGSGGMGEVYRAIDTRLDRTVALKVLPDAVARDPDRLSRFEREARTLASLNHPNIAQVYGFEDRALVMELLEGETLRSRLEQGSLTVRKAIDYASQIARGLAAAHERGIIHRDLKPENVFVLRDGHVKILDFGLARQIIAPSSGATETVADVGAATDPGTVMGTVGYMAPEQVRNQALDARADLFALGAVLYEMLSGQRAFRRDTGAETMTAILKEDPPELTAARSDISPALDRIVRHCLEKGPLERFQTARDVAFALDALSGSGSAPTVVASETRPRTRRERWIWAAFTAGLLGLLMWQTLGRSAAPAAPFPPVYRSSLTIPEGVRLAELVPPGLRMALSPDGRMVAFAGAAGAVGTTKRALWVQSLVDGSVRELADTNNSSAPFWSPDSRQIGFLTLGSNVEALRKIDAIGGPVTTISQSGGAGTWGADDTILFSTRGATGIYRVSSQGGAPPELLARSALTRQFRFPSFLPDGRHFLFTHLEPSGETPWATSVHSLDSPEVRPLIASQSLIRAAYASGALLFSRMGTVFAQRFDPARLELSGEPITIATNVEEQDLGGAAFTVSTSGALIYQPAQALTRTKLMWLSRNGSTLSTLSDEADYANLELSHDGRRLAVGVMDPATRTRDIYLVDVARGVRQRLTFDPSDERSAIWSADDQRVIYNSKGFNLYRRASDFTGGDEGIQIDPPSKDPREISPDGKLLLYRRSGETTGNDLWVKPLDGTGQPRLIVGSPFDENYGGFSPDGQSIVYASDESGQYEIYVMSLASGGGKTQISTGGGTFPRWRKDSREIVYLTPDRVMMGVPVKGSGAQFHASAAIPLFRADTVRGPAIPYDLTADGQRFIVNLPIASTAPASLTLIVNWPELLKK